MDILLADCGIMPQSRADRQHPFNHEAQGRQTAESLDGVVEVLERLAAGLRASPTGSRPYARGVVPDERVYRLARLPSVLYIRVVMGTAPQFQEVMAGWEDQPPSWRERYFGEMRHKKIIPTAKPGGGKGSIHLDKEHYVRGLLGLAASRPGEVDEVIQEFEPLRCQGSIPPDIELPNDTLGEYLGRMLDEVAVPLSKGEVLSPHLLSWLEGWELLMCRVPPVGQVVTKTDGKREEYFFHGGLQPLKALTRAIMLSGNALLDVGKMLADTYIYREMEAKRKASSGTKSVKTYGRLESAGTLRQKGTPAPSSYPARVNGSDSSLNAPEGNKDGNSSQGHLVSDDFQDSTAN